MSAPGNPYRPTQSPPTPDRPADDPSQLAEKAKSDLADLSEEVSQQAAAIGQEAQAQAGELAEQAKGMASQQKDLLVEQIDGVSTALHRVAGDLEVNNQASAPYVRMMADGAQRLTSTLRNNNVDDILNIVQDFGRKQPVAFLGVAALLGFAASRFVTASATRQHQTAEPREQQIVDRATSYSSEGKTSSDGTAAPDYEHSVGGKDAGI